MANYCFMHTRNKGRVGSIGILIKLNIETEKTSFTNGGPHKLLDRPKGAILARR